MYTVILLSKFTKMVLMMENIKADSQREAEKIAFGCMLNSQAWVIG